MDVVARHVKKRLAEISAAVDALPALDFVADDKAGALAERVLDEMRRPCATRRAASHCRAASGRIFD